MALVEVGAISNSKLEGGGRNTSYELSCMN